MKVHYHFFPTLLVWCEGSFLSMGFFPGHTANHYPTHPTCWLASWKYDLKFLFIQHQPIRDCIECLWIEHNAKSPFLHCLVRDHVHKFFILLTKGTELLPLVTKKLLFSAVPYSILITHTLFWMPFFIIGTQLWGWTKISPISWNFLLSRCVARGIHIPPWLWLYSLSTIMKMEIILSSTMFSFSVSTSSSPGFTRCAYPRACLENTSKFIIHGGPSRCSSLICYFSAESHFERSVRTLSFPLLGVWKRAFTALATYSLSICARQGTINCKIQKSIKCKTGK